MNSRIGLAFQAFAPVMGGAWAGGSHRCCAQVVKPVVARRAKFLARQQLDSKGREYIRLDGLLKLTGMVETGGEAKIRIKNGNVNVNGKVEVRRGRKLYEGDVVALEDEDAVKVNFTTVAESGDDWL